MLGSFEVLPDALSGLRVNRQTPFLPALARDLE